MRYLFLTVLAVVFMLPDRCKAAEKPRKVVLIAGPLDKGHPPGTHEYEKSVRLLKHCLDRSPDCAIPRHRDPYRRLAR